jgi:hypothetical protein
MLAINNRDTSLGASPFFLIHQYNIKPIQQFEPLAKPSPPAIAAEQFANNLRVAQDFTQAAMASAQQRMEDNSNKTRDQAQVFKVGDAVWLNLKNISTPQASKKLAWLNAKYRVRKIVSSHVVELNVPTGIFPRFHVDLLKGAAEDPLPLQVMENAQPPPLIPATEDREAEYEVERVLRAESNKRGRGKRREVLVKWTGYTDCMWEPRTNLENTAALDEFEARYGPDDGVGEENAGAMVGPRRGPRGRNAHLLMLGTASFDWLRREGALPER